MESPPATRSENPVSDFPLTVRVIAVKPMSLISGYEHQERQPAFVVDIGGDSRNPPQQLGDGLLVTLKDFRPSPIMSPSV